MGKKIFLHCKELENYPYPESSPFKTHRAGETVKSLQSMGMFIGGEKILMEPRPASRTVLEKYHTPEYLDILEKMNEGQYDVEWMHMGLGTGDCPAFKGVFDYNALAAGATVLGAEQIVAGGVDLAFNPSGGLHHAFPDKSGGFCYINDVVLGCMTLAEAGKRVLFIDIDVHQTDGVQHAFYQRNDVMVISFHESGKYLFPGTGFVNEIGENDGKGYTVNMPFPPGTFDDIYMKAFRSVALPLVHAYEPDVIVLEVGADTLSGDPLAHLSLTNNVYVEVINLLKAFGKPMLVTGGGGYNVENTVRAWSLVWLTLCGEEGGDDMMAGMGGVMLESTDWHGGAGLRDRVLMPDQKQQELVVPEVEELIHQIKTTVFPIHGIKK